MQYIIGAGATGSLITAYLLRAGMDATIADTSHERIGHIRTNGIHLEGFRGDFHVSVPAAAHLPELLTSQTHPEHIFLCVHPRALPAVLPKVVHAFPNVPVVTFTSGLSPFHAREIRGAAQCVPAVANLESRLTDSGTVETNFHNFIWLGEFDGAHSERLDAIQLVLSHVAPAFLTKVITGMVWSKAIYSLEAMLPALAGMAPRDVFDKAVYRRLAAALVREGIALANATGVTPIAFDFFDPNLYGAENAKQGAVTDIWIRNAWIRHEQFRVGLEAQFPNLVGLTWLLSPKNPDEEASALLADMLGTAQHIGQPVPLANALADIHQAIRQGQRAPGRETLDALEHTRQQLAIHVPYPEL
jgi:2-dehydropantoate 2-reductase